MADFFHASFLNLTRIELTGLVSVETRALRRAVCKENTYVA
jgi:hypothetical protein